MSMIVNSTTGRLPLDGTGSAVAAARLDPANTFAAVSQLMKEYIDNGSQKAWQDVKTIIDRVYAGVASTLDTLEAETAFSKEIKAQVSAGKRLFFKPNLVILPLIDYRTHGRGMPGSNAEWAFTAAVIRWFHDRLGLSYHQMAMGEAGMTTTAGAELASQLCGQTVTREAVLEGKYPNGAGGWGFYFVRRYLAENHDPKHTDDPMQGYQESLDGLCLPPGENTHKLLVYNLNTLNEKNSRDVAVPDGINFKTVTLHKAIAGGNPADRADMAAWPGCYLVNLPKLKMHVLELFTCALKNVGMGMFGMEVNSAKEPGKYRWKYSIPNFRVPSFKFGVPHNRWMLETEEKSFKPLRNPDGSYRWRKTGGMEASIADSFQAVKNSHVSMLHVVDAIETANINHSGPDGVVVPEGLIFAATDAVAVDTCGARYLYNLVPMAEAGRIAQEFKLSSDVIRQSPLPQQEGNNIGTGQGYDSPFSRYHGLRHCAERGLGQQQFYVTGKDLWQGGTLGSLGGRLGRIEGGSFQELLTTTVYHAPNKALMDFQAAIFKYLELNDRMTGSSYKKQLLADYDDNQDGIIDYLETGKSGGYPPMAMGMALMNEKIDPGEILKYRFLISATQNKVLHKEWNTEGHNLGEGNAVGQAATRAFNMSKSATEKPDPLYQGRVWGKGKWPSLQYVLELQHYARVYGQMFPDRIDAMMSLYGMAFSYADRKFNQGKYCNPQAMAKNQDIIAGYHRDVAGGGIKLPFTVHVPPGLGSYHGVNYPNVGETIDPGLVFTAEFRGNEVWRDLDLSPLF
jgi:hypothetical protein